MNQRALKKLPGLLVLLPLIAAADPAELVREQCAGCHSLDRAAYEARTTTDRLDQKAPPLYYAGNKFRREWLVEWLGEPSRIRPAGLLSAEHVRSTPDGDVIDESTFDEHPVLNGADAAQLADYLMTLRPLDAQMDAQLAGQAYQPGEISLRMGQMNFGKFKGCDACHRDAPDYGGESGPELHTAWSRLQPEFIAAFIADPVALDPHTTMPRSGLNAVEVNKLVDYLRVIAEEEP